MSFHFVSLVRAGHSTHYVLADGGRIVGRARLQHTYETLWSTHPHITTLGVLPVPGSMLTSPPHISPFNPPSDSLGGSYCYPILHTARKWQSRTGTQGSWPEFSSELLQCLGSFIRSFIHSANCSSENPYASTPPSSGQTLPSRNGSSHPPWVFYTRLEV